jgi:YD repeat-containing protein
MTISRLRISYLAGLVVVFIGFSIYSTARACNGTGPYPAGEPTSDQSEGDGNDSENSPHSEDCDPVQLAEGHKVESATDLFVQLTGMDLKFSRSYRSKPGERHIYRFAQNWFLDSLSYVEFVSSPVGVGVYDNAANFRLFLVNGSEMRPGPAGEQRGFYAAGDPLDPDDAAIPLWDPRMATWDPQANAVRDRFIWILEQPGQWRRGYFCENELNGLSQSQNEGYLTGLLAFEEDWYGNRRYYEYDGSEYDTWVPEDNVTYGQRPVAIYCFRADQDPSTDAPEAKIVLEWVGINDPATELVDAPTDTNPVPATFGLLRRIYVERPNGQGGLVETQRVVYHYFNDWDSHPVVGAHSDLGVGRNYSSSSGGPDLIQTVHYERVDAAESGLPADDAEPITDATIGYPARTRVTQYRYHHSSRWFGSNYDSGGTWDYLAPQSDPFTEPQQTSAYRLGQHHQLKLIIEPEQFEFAHQQVNSERLAENPPQPALSTAAFAELLLSTHDIGHDPSGAVDGIVYGTTRVADLASKRVLNYETSGDWRVLRQYVRSGCGCGGASADDGGVVYQYGYYTHNFTLHTDAYNKTTVKVERTLGNTTQGQLSFPFHRAWFYDFTRFDELPQLGVGAPYMVNKALYAEDPIANPSADPWVWHYVYDASDRNVIRRMEPSACSSYTHGTSSTAPSYSASASEGLVQGFEYDDNNRLRTTYIREGAGTAATDLEAGTATPGPTGATPLNGWIRVSRATYGNGTPGDGSSGNTFEYLVTSVERFRSATNQSAADNIEVETFRYGFYDDDAGNDFDADESRIAWIERSVEGELASENGPAISSLTYNQYTAFDENGDAIWIVDPSNSFTKLEYGGPTGGVSKITLNAQNTSLSLSGVKPAFPPIDQSVADTYADGGSLVSEMTYDLLGRLVSETPPGGVETLYRHEMRLGDPADRPNSRYFARVTLPPIIDAQAETFGGPAVIEQFSASDKSIGRSEYAPDLVSGAYPSDTNQAIGSELARFTTEHDRSGNMVAITRWHDVPTGFYRDRYFYDKLGRLEYTVSAAGDVTRSVYDDLDRQIEEHVGVTADPQGVTATQLAALSLVRTMGWEYDGGSVGDGNLTALHAYVDDATTQEVRTTTYSYDFRNRQTGTIPPHAPKDIRVYDNLDRLVEWALIGNISAGDQMTETDRVRYATAAFSQRGLPYRQRLAVDPGSATPTFLATDSWFDERGLEIARRSPNAAVVEIDRDGLGRSATTYLTDGNGLVPGVGTSYAAATGRTGDTVIEEQAVAFHASNAGGLNSPNAPFTHGGLPKTITRWERAHDASSTGALSAASTSASVASYFGVVYDAADRQTKLIDFGTNSVSGLFETGSSTLNLTSPPTYAKVWQTTYAIDGMPEDSVDPEGVVTRAVYDDLDRLVATIENYVNAVVSTSADPWGREASLGTQSGTDEDRVTIFGLNANDQVLFRVAINDISGTPEEQVTAYTYDVVRGQKAAPSTAPTNSVSSKSLLFRVQYPEEYDASIAKYEEFYYNARGEVIAVGDQNGTVREIERDDLGRVTADRVLYAPSTVDQTAMALEYEYATDTGLLKFARTVDGAGTTVLNAIRYTYNDLFQITEVLQNPLADIGDSGTAAYELAVEYAYDDPFSTTGANYSRLDELLYPSDPGGTLVRTMLEHRYGGETPAGLDDAISRVSGLTWRRDGMGVRAAGVDYDFVGMNRFAIMDLIEPASSTQGVPGLRRDYHVAPDASATTASGLYHSLDRFGRQARQLWVPGDFVAGNKPALFDYAYTYDGVDNPLTRADRRAGGLGSLGDDARYTHDGLHRLKTAERGKENGSSFTHVSGKSQQWGLDQLGNSLDRFTDNATPLGSFTTADTEVEGEHNLVNELDRLDEFSGGALQEFWTHGYDDAGNQTSRTLDATPADPMDPPQSVWSYTYDAWHRLVAVDVGETPRAAYTYYALHQRATRLADMDPLVPESGGSFDERNHYYYDADWRLLEEQTFGVDSQPGTPGDHLSSIQRLWSDEYIDHLLAYQTDTLGNGQSADPDGDFTNAETMYALTDRLYSVVGLVGISGRMLERVQYTPYGVASAWHFADLNRDGYVNGGDLGLFLGAWGSANPDADFNNDGNVDGADQGFLLGSYGGVSPVPEGWVSQLGNSIGYAGYSYDFAANTFLSRNRFFSATQQRWLSRDHIGTRLDSRLATPSHQLLTATTCSECITTFGHFEYNADARYDFSSNLYEYLNSSPLATMDPFGEGEHKKRGSKNKANEGKHQKGQTRQQNDQKRSKERGTSQKRNRGNQGGGSSQSGNNNNKNNNASKGNQESRQSKKQQRRNGRMKGNGAADGRVVKGLAIGTCIAAAAKAFDNCLSAAEDSYLDGVRVEGSIPCAKDRKAYRDALEDSYRLDAAACSADYAAMSLACMLPFGF